MSDEFETVELEYSEDDILCYLIDEDGHEIGFTVNEDGREIEYFYADAYQEEPDDADMPSTRGLTGKADPSDPADPDIIEMEIPEDDILYYLVDEGGNELGFVIDQDGIEVECYYEEDDEADSSQAKTYTPEKASDHGYLHKLASIAGHEGNKAREKASAELDKVRGKAEVQAGKAKKAALEQRDRAKAKADEMDIQITREGVAEATSDLNALAKEGAETAKELKEAYDDIMDNFGFLMPKKMRRKFP